MTRALTRKEEKRKLKSLVKAEPKPIEITRVYIYSWCGMYVVTSAREELSHNNDGLLGIGSDVNKTWNN